MAADFYRQLKSSPRVRDQVLPQRDGCELPLHSFATSGWMLHHVNAPLWRFAWADQDELRTWRRWQAALQVERQARSNGWASVTPTQAHASDDVMLVAVSMLTGETEETWWTRFRFPFSSAPFGVTDIM